MDETTSASFRHSSTRLKHGEGIGAVGKAVKRVGSSNLLLQVRRPRCTRNQRNRATNRARCFSASPVSFPSFTRGKSPGLFFSARETKDANNRVEKWLQNDSEELERYCTNCVILFTPTTLIDKWETVMAYRVANVLVGSVRVGDFVYK